jgi:hypothetical protein
VHNAFVSEIETDLSGRWALDASVADAVASRSFIRTTDGTWNLRPSEQYFTLLEPMLESLRLFDVYRAVECPLLIYRCTRAETTPEPVPGADEVMNGYDRGLARDLTALEAERPNVHVRTLDATHMMIFEIPEEVAGDILSLTA